MRRILAVFVAMCFINAQFALAKFTSDQGRLQKNAAIKLDFDKLSKNPDPMVKPLETATMNFLELYGQGKDTAQALNSVRAELNALHSNNPQTTTRLNMTDDVLKESILRATANANYKLADKRPTIQATILGYAVTLGLACIGIAFCAAVYSGPHERVVAPTTTQGAR